MNDSNDLLKEFNSKPPYPPLEKKDPLPHLVKQKQPYEAVDRTTKPERFKIYDRQGNFDIYSYGHLLEISFQKGNLIITTTTRSFTLSGKNLDKVADLLGDRKVKNLIEFNADIYTLPPQKSAIVIESIERED